MPGNKQNFHILIVVNTLLTFFLILLSNLGVLPIKSAGDFLFFTFLSFAFALYRPGWAFLFFVGSVMLENINLAPEAVGIAVRPYQFLGALTILALAVRLLTKRIKLDFFQFRWFDWLPIGILAGSFLAVFNAPEKMMSLKLSIILTSFAILYFLVRTYVQNLEDVKKITPFFLSSSIVVALYGIWQNIRFAGGLSNFEVMPGRPNATFAEADWLGGFLIILLVAIFSLVLYFKKSVLQSQKSKNLKLFLSSYAFLVIIFILIIITVSRSAWLGALVATAFFLLLSWKVFDFKNLAKLKLSLFASFLVAISLVYIFNLTDFQLGNRAQSTASGLQKITIACDQKTDLPEKIENVSELEKYSCRHINLEEIEAEKSAGKAVSEIYRNDPNVNIRGQIYQRSWQEIKTHPILGIGWGSVSQILGNDGRGANLNASNIFLELWLGSGILGILSFLIFIIYILATNFKNYFSQNSDEEAKIFNIFIIATILGLLTFNLFNSGIMLAFLWVVLGISMVKDKEE